MLCVTIVVDASWPIVTQHDVKATGNLTETKDFEVSKVIDRALSRLIVRWVFEVTEAVVMELVDA